MQKILVISAEPALTEALAGELTEYSLVVAGPSEDLSSLLQDVCMVVLDKGSVATVTLPETMPLLAVNRPLRLVELLYTIRQRLQAQSQSAADETRSVGDCVFLVRERVFASADGTQRVPLTEKEGDLLSKLLENNNKILSKDALLKEVWGYAEGTDTHTIETHIYRLRGKLKQVNPQLDIEAVDNSGYRIIF